MPSLRYTSPGVGFYDARYLRRDIDTAQILTADSLILKPSANTVDTFSMTQSDGTPVFDIDTINRRIIVTSGVTGQSTIEAGLIVNNASGGGAIDDFQVNTDTLTAILVDASADTMVFGVPITDKIMFTQVDGNEYIDSLNDGYMDYRATTAHRFGDGTNQLTIAADGELGLEGTARVTVDMYITASGVKAPAANPAAFISYGLCGAWEFEEKAGGSEENISGTLKLPTQMDKTVAPVFKVGWSAPGSSPGTCVWQLEYLYLSPNESTANTTPDDTLTIKGTASGTPDGLIVTAFAALATPSATDQAMFFKITRLNNDGDDNIGASIHLRGLLFTHTRDTLGTPL